MDFPAAPPPPIATPARVYPGAVRVYLRTAAFLFPLSVFLGFNNIFLAPKVREIWHLAGITAPNANAVLTLAGTVGSYTFFLTFGFIVLIAVLEGFVPGWKKIRSLSMDILIWLAMVATLVGITALTVSVCIAVPVVLTGH